jgi:hypothetical protein
MQPIHSLGTFTVKITPVQDPAAIEPSIHRMQLDKQFQGSLQAVSKGEMMAIGSGAPGSSGAYVALERVEGTLDGKRGSFALQHTGVMDRGEPTLSIAVVPGSGTGELAGLSGSMKIDIVNGVHHYQFHYAIHPSAAE